MNPLEDARIEDDWFHNGALRQQNLVRACAQEATRVS
jgi:hypothetical protein